MADYFIGDIQGCYSGLQKALATIAFNPSKDTLWLTGDLVARGEDSLSTLTFLYKYQDSVKTVLGNHDLHLLAVANKLKRNNPKDRLSNLLTNNKLPQYLDWIRQQPLVRPLPEKSGYMSHAGLAPHWNSEDAEYWGQQISHELTQANYVKFLPLMYGNKIQNWHQTVTDIQKIQYSISALTRMRYCLTDGSLDFDNKSHPNELSSSEKRRLVAWFKIQPERFEKQTWVFGHWASLMGETEHPNIIGLDTGFVWGNALTILHWQKQELITLY